MNPSDHVLSMLAEPYFTVNESKQGSWWNRYYELKLEFSADDFEQFSKHFDQLGAELVTWQKKYGIRAKRLHVRLLVHPWILKRVLQRLQADAGQAHGYGQFCRYGTVILHLFNPLDQAGQHYLLYDNGKIAPSVKL